MKLQCALCLEPSTGQFFYQEKPFCCLGCQTVYTILQARGGLGMEEVCQEKAEEVVRIRFEIEDLFCFYCKDVIEWVLKRSVGVLHSVVDYSTDICIVDYDPRKITQEEIYQKISDLSYRPKSFEQEEKKSTLKMRLGVAAFFSINTMMFTYPVLVGLYEESHSFGLLFGWFAFFSSLPILGYAGIPIFKRALIAARAGFLGMEVLVTLGVFSSFILSTYRLVNHSLELYFDTMGVVVTFVLLGKWMEGRAKVSAKTKMRLLFKSLPKRARVNDQFILIKDLHPEDLITSLCGEKIVVDGVVEEGTGWLDASLLTGESDPIFVEKGSVLKSGSILIEGLLRYKKRGQTSTLESIVEMVEASLLKKEAAKSQFFAFFVPMVSLLAVFSQNPLAVLLISCPCAIGIAAPLAESKLIDRLLALGVIVRNHKALSFLGREDFFVFDKTGTLTDKEWDLTTDLKGAAPIIKTLCLHSTHPVAKALLKKMEHVPKVDLASIREVAGKGIMAQERYFLGSPQWLQIEHECSIAYLEKGQKPLLIHLEDRIRPEIPELLAALDCAVYIYSGDRQAKVKRVANELKIAHFAADLSPLEKKERIEALKNLGIVAFVGDGINDAGALAASTLSFVPFNGSDLSAQTADFLLTQENLGVIIQARRLACRGRRILKQNLFWAYVYNLIGIPLAFFGLLNPILATFFMVISSLIVLFNSKRL